EAGQAQAEGKPGTELGRHRRHNVEDRRRNVGRGLEGTGHDVAVRVEAHGLDERPSDVDADHAHSISIRSRREPLSAGSVESTRSCDSSSMTASSALTLSMPAFSRWIIAR